MTTDAPLFHTTLRQRTASAVSDENLRATMHTVTDTFRDRSAAAYAKLDDVEGLRVAARATKARILDHLPAMLERLADGVVAAGGSVCWATTAADANRYVAGLVGRRRARKVVKSKSMMTEEIGLNGVLESIGVEVTETDLGEWIIQLARELPSHIILPAIHRTRREVADVLERVAGGDLSDVPEELAAFARGRLRQKFLEADVGISGVNFGVAESGSVVVITNEGNGRLCQSVPPVHVAIMGMERVVETWADLDLLLALLPRAATGQAITTYVSAITGPRRAGEVDGPEEFHLVILDNGRSEILGSEFNEMLACIRCGACLNHCPVYRQVGGHAYGWVYSGPMGAVLTPLLLRDHHAPEVANASSLCGACWDACPVGIPLQDLLLALRRRTAEHEAGRVERLAWDAWAATWSSPARYRASLRAAGWVSPLVARSPAGPPAHWAATRQPFPVSRASFRDLWRRGEV